MGDWPKECQAPISTQFIPAIGKLHEPGHKDEDHEQFSLNLIMWAALTDGEGMERIWGVHNPLGNSTKTMGPGARADNLEAAFAFWNWLKYISMGKTLWNRYIEAIKDRNKQTAAHEGLTDNIGTDITSQWEKQCEAWEKAPFPKPIEGNPFKVDRKYMNKDTALAELDREEEERIRKGGSRYHATSPASLVQMALDIKDAQDRIIQDRSKTTLDAARETNKLKEQRTALRRRFQVYEQVRAVYMPGLLQFLSEHQTDNVEVVRPELQKLWLPSELPPDQVDQICVPGLQDAEAKLQSARCHDSLALLRRTLTVKTRMMLFRIQMYEANGSRVDQGKS
ncbi:hypothetical protein MPER_11784 [Moniliophthora perniciosa FA553]|nr:hypothetical protein MPER_11784 [Moniliophthora perniciosa FA553]